MPTSVDKEGLRAAYNDVRDDNTESNWATFIYDGDIITHERTGSDLKGFEDRFQQADGERIFGFVRVQTGDEMSKRVKFALAIWCGSDVSVLKRAKVSTDKVLVKECIQNFAIEFTTADLDDIKEETIRHELIKAGGANYGTGIRD